MPTILACSQKYIVEKIPQTLVANKSVEKRNNHPQKLISNLDLADAYKHVVFRICFIILQ
jgi:t-SNARE complex subunit (syntaxin)